MSSLLFLFLTVLQIWLVSSWMPMLHLGHPMTATNELNLTGFASQGGFGGREAYLKQKLDHTQEVKEWSQRYFYNNRYYRKGGNVAFLMLGGMGVLDIGWVTNEKIPFVQMAKERGAMMFALEHRFYGKSRPTDDLSVKNLKYLTIEQAIGDIKTFIEEMNKKHKLENPKWIVFGGSYAGSLALWAREKYKDENLIAGAVASSPIMRPKFDFWEATQFAEKEIQKVDKKCGESIRIGFMQMIDMLGNQVGRSQLSELFKMRPRFLTPDLRNIQLLNSIQLNNFISAVQFRGGPYMQNGTHSYNLKQLCEIMNTETIDQLTALERVSNVRHLQSKYLNDMDKYTPVDFDALMKYLLKKDFDEEGWASVDRASLWQRCTQLGSFPTTDGAINSIFGSLVSIDFYADLCQVFGEKFNAEHIEMTVEETLQHYGGADNYKGTNVVIANGGSDPYHLLSKLSSRDPTVVTYLIEGGSHCGDMFPFEFNNSPTAAPGTKLIHLLTAQNIDTWISGVPSPFHIDKKEPEKQLVKLEVSAMPATPLPSPSLNGVKSRFSLFKRQSTQAVATQLTPREMDILQRVRLGRPPHGFVPNLDTVDTPSEYETGYFTQPVDHFNNQNPATFDQKYYKNEQWAREGGPIFLMIGGEGPSSSKWILNENYTWLQWAKKFGATTYMLEHRYYGDSDLQRLLFDSTDTKLKRTYTTYLSSLQMLYDTANFIQAIDADNGKKGTWIVFGGSYAGSLALWMRKLFPNLVHGAVGSSAPLEAKLDYHEYYQVVEASIREYSEDCAYAIGEGFEDIHEKMLSERGREEISKTFKLNPPWDDVSDVFEIDKQFFFWNLMEQFTAAVQYSGDNSGGYADGHGIPDLCKIMTNERRTPMARIAEFNEYMTRFFTGKPAFEYTFNSYKEFVSTAYKAQFATDKKAAAGTLWLWQTCTEFGFYGTTDSGYSLFGNPLPLNFFTQLCSDLFGWKIDYSAEMNRRATLNVNNRYGGRYKYEKTNVVMTYGTLDPWTALGPVECKETENCLMIKGTAHCAEMYPAREADLPSLKEARSKIENIIEGWVQAKKVSQDQRPVEKNSKKSFFSFLHRQ
uniref:Intestinal prolyl carboxypeptidase 1 n=1 Tax=Haemonchus contortus TaxID=6289 RepID=A0A7I5E9W2_HAECO